MSVPGVPTGTVAFLFSDIEGSTRLWEQEPRAMAVALRRHDEILRGSLADEGGHVFSTAGDAYGAAFATVEAAVRTALRTQRALCAEAWPSGAEVRVRLGVHIGTAEARDGDYYGSEVNRAARIMSLAHGGQVLVSGVAAEVLRPDAVGRITLHDLGIHHLKDLLTPERIFQLAAEGLPASFPPLRSRPTGNIPPSHPFAVGREAEAAELADAVGDERLVTLVGEGTVGAAVGTAVCLAAARASAPRFPDGTWHVDLGQVARVDEVPAALLDALGVPAAGGASSVPPASSVSSGPVSAPVALAAALDGRRALLVLDGAALDRALLVDAVRELLALRSVSVLVTAGEPLGLDGERVVLAREHGLPPDLERLRRGRLVGRSGELDGLEGEWARAVEGERRVVLIGGESGIGKTRLAAELADRAARLDGLVLHGGWDEEGVADHQAFREAWSRHLDQVDPATLRARFGDLLADLGLLLPAAARLAWAPASVSPPLAPSGPTTSRGSPAGPSSSSPSASWGTERVASPNEADDRFRLLDGIDAWLARLASVQPVLLWLDDLQWADPSSLQVLVHLARSSRPAPVLIVATYQPAAVTPGDEVSHAIGVLHRYPGYRKVDLGGLATNASAQLVDDLTRDQHVGLGPRTAVLLHRWSGGNPFLLQELSQLVREAASSRGARADSVIDLEDLGVTESVRDVVRWRLAQRSPQLAETLTVASVIGSTFDAATVAEVTGIDAATVGDLVDEAVRAGFIDEVDATGSRHAFRKDLVRQALYQDLGASRRATLHRHVLACLLARDGPDPAELARHLSASAGPDDLEQVVEYATLAAQRADARRAYENAARHHDQALRVLDRHPDVGAPRLELLLDAGQAHNRAGALGAGRERLRRAAAEARARGRDDLFARAALQFGGIVPLSPTPDPEAAALLQEVIDRFPAESPERALALARQAEWLHQAMPGDERTAQAEEAVGIARRLGDPGLVGRVLSSAMSARYGPGGAHLALPVGEEVVALGREVGDDELVFQGMKHELYGLFATNRMAETGAVVGTLRRLGEHLSQPEYLRIAVMWDAVVATFEGRFADADVRARQARTITLTGDHSQVDAIQLMLRLPQLALRGASAAVMHVLEVAPDPGTRPMLAWFHAENGDLARARSYLEGPGVVAAIERTSDYSFWCDVLGYATAARLLGDLDALRALHAMVVAQGDADVNCVLGVAAFLGAVSHHRGALAAALCEWEPAVADLERGLAHHQAMGAHPWVALSQIELARALRGRAAPGDEARADELTRAALATAGALDLASVRRRAEWPLGAGGTPG